jgi:hypothetical protein
MAIQSSKFSPALSPGSSYEEYVSPQWVALLKILDMNVRYFMVLKAARPLVVNEKQLNEFVAAIRSVVEMAHTSAAFWSEALGLTRRAAKV